MLMREILSYQSPVNAVSYAPVRRSEHKGIGCVTLICALAGTGSQIGTARAQALTPTLELEHKLEASRRCAECHDYPNRAARQGELAYAPYAWQGTLMANAARDPVFWAAVALAAQDDPQHTEACIRCHSPKAFYEGRKKATHPSQFQFTDFDGVGCDVCHRMDGHGSPEIGNAQFHLDDFVPEGKKSPVKRGPWDYTNFDTKRLNHGWSTDSSYLASSESCGSCHNVTTPRPWVDGLGKQIGPGFPEQRTYTEWKQSAFAVAGTPEFRSCQDCHMQAVDNVAGSRVMDREEMLHAKGGRHHQFAGANIPMLEFLKQKFGDTGSRDVSSAAFDDAIKANRRSLDSAAKVTLSGPPSVDLRQGLAPLQVRVENLSGHKLPTGYSEGRVMWVELTARYRGTVVYHSGLWDEAKRSIGQDPQVRRYEGIAQEAATGVRNHLLKNNRWVSDTRIPPKGLKPHPETNPLTDRYPLINGTFQHFDQFQYHFPAAQAVRDQSADNTSDDVLEISARLLYWINTDSYIAQLARDNQSNDSGQTLLRDWNAFAGKVPMELTRAELAIPITGFPAIPPQEPPPGDEGCGCRQSGPASLLWGIIGLAGLGGLRRRRF